MAKMRAVDAAMYVLEKEGITTAFGVPGAAINPFYSAMRKHGGIRHILARHVEGASHMAEGYTRATAGNIGVCLGTSGPAGTDMITALYSASADSIPLLLIPFLFCVLPARLRAPVCIKKISRPLILKQLLNRSAKWRLQFVKRRWCLVCCNRRFT